MKKKKLLCLLLALVLMFLSVNFSSVPVQAQEPDTSDIEAEKAQIDAEIQAYEQKLAEIQTDTTKQKEYLETLESQIDAIEEKANAIQTEVNELNVEINDLTQQYNQLKAKIDEKNKSIENANILIAQTEANINQSKDYLAAKLRQSYLEGEESTIKILMGADSLASFLTRLEMVQRSADSSREAIDDFEEKVVTLNETKKTLESDKKVLAESQQKVVETRNTYVERKTELETNQKEFAQTVKTIETKYAQVETYVASLDQSSSLYQDRITALEQQKAEADAEIDRIIENYYATQLPSENNTPEADVPSDGGTNYPSTDEVYTTTDTWAWPVGNIDYYISSDYGYRDSVMGTNPNHAAVDISGSGFYGTSIYAARSGTVIFSGDDGYGYGNYVLIDHGDGYITQYAHNSQNLVYSGDVVTKGQCIAYAGSTGISTGPHLHFAIKYNGEPVDPANFYSAYL